MKDHETMLLNRVTPEIMDQVSLQIENRLKANFDKTHKQNIEQLHALCAKTLKQVSEQEKITVEAINNLRSDIYD